MKIKKQFLLITAFSLLSACGDPSENWGTFEAEEICNAGVALKFGKSLDDLSSRYLEDWGKYAISYVRDTDNKLFTYYCRPTSKEALIVEKIEDAGSLKNRTMFEVDGDSLHVKQVLQGRVVDSSIFTKAHFE